MPVLGYWNIRGLAQPIRLLLNYVGEEFEDKQYACGPAPDYISVGWRADKYSLGLDFPNLPYYIDGDVKLSQSNAILRYIGRKHNLDGTDEVQKRLVDVMENQSMDLRNAAVGLFYSSKFSEMKANYLENLEKKLKDFETYMNGKDYFAGDTITFVDFPMYELLDQHRILESSCLDNCPNLKAFMAKFENNEAIKKYMTSEAFMSKPINNVMAKFGNE